ncbi:hypothetical protein GA0070215_12272 [Micromonospora marina]|uniref:Uncharacterized protein n=1 Tax=Micromonospora marina TaxID=307120 RepID=A0A1C5A085_9ACTN|nr:hypothetical protein GA0070215_12272 [Micromonospora marina]
MSSARRATDVVARRDLGPPLSSAAVRRLTRPVPLPGPGPGAGIRPSGSA